MGVFVDCGESVFFGKPKTTRGKSNKPIKNNQGRRTSNQKKLQS